MGRKKTQEQCITDFIRVHGDKYDYSDVVYKWNKIPVNVICKKHGKFQITPHNHIQGRGCRVCGVENNKQLFTMPTEEFIMKSNIIHNNKYDYKKTDLYNRNKKGEVIITCPIHGDFLQTPNNHFYGGCKKCGMLRTIEARLMSSTTFIEKAKTIHGDLYNYAKTNLKEKDSKGNIVITCKIHGDFKQRYDHHLNGSGCPYCKASHMENEIRRILKENNIIFEEQKRFYWLGLLSLDFYLPQQNIAIECQGIQHFKSIEYFGGEKALNEYKKRDLKKKLLCQDNGINLLYYSNINYNFPYKVLTDKEELLEFILQQ